MNQQRHISPGGARLAGRVEATPRRLGGAAPPSSPLLRPDDPPTDRKRVRLFPNRWPTNCGQSASLSPVRATVCPNRHSWVCGWTRLCAVLESKKTPMNSQKSRLIQPNPTKSPTPQPGLSSDLPRRSPAEAGALAKEDPSSVGHAKEKLRAPHSEFRPSQTKSDLSSL